MNGQQLIIVYIGIFGALCAAIYGLIMAFSKKSPYQDYQEEGFSGSTEYIFAGVGMGVALVFALLKGLTKILD